MSKRRLIPFIYSADIAYLVELGDGYARFYYNGELITAIESPYTEDEAFNLHYSQLADVMRIAANATQPKKLKRVTTIRFEFEDIDFNYGPFLLRNDLVDLFESSPTEMKCSVKQRGETGVLTATSAVFEKGHVGAKFQLTHPPTTKIVSSSGSATSDTIKVKGKASLITRGTWTGTVVFERNVNDAGWEAFRTYKSNDNRNAALSWVEEEDEVLYRIRPEAGMSAGFRAELTIEEHYYSGIVKIISVASQTVAVVEVITEIQSTDYTRRWAESAWSDFRGWPSTVSFFENRACYAGAISASLRSAGAAFEYPSLKEIE